MKTTTLALLIPALLGASLQILPADPFAESSAPAADPTGNGPSPAPAPPTGIFPGPALPSANAPAPPAPTPPPAGAVGMGGMGGGMSGMGGFGVGGGFAFHGASPPALVVTQPMTTETRAQWLEDLRIMDKLLREAVGRAGGDGPRQAMGIPLVVFDQPEGQPMYVEDFGALFSYRVGFPLATDGQAATRKTEKPTGSAWERAKKEIEGPQNGPGLSDEQQAAVVTSWGVQPPEASTVPPMPRMPPRSVVDAFRQRYGIPPSAPPPGGAPVEFDPAKVDALVAAVLAVLPEAKNIRQCKESECVLVTIAGPNDPGPPARLTFKVKKSDIDAAASGKLTPEEFKKRVAQNLG